PHGDGLQCRVPVDLLELAASSVAYAPQRPGQPAGMAGKRRRGTSLRAQESAVVRVGLVSRDGELVVMPADEEDSASAVTATADGPDGCAGHALGFLLGVDGSYRSSAELAGRCRSAGLNEPWRGTRPHSLPW